MGKFGIMDSDSEDDLEIGLNPPISTIAESPIPAIADPTPAIAESPILAIADPTPSRNNTLAIGIYMHGGLLNDTKGNPLKNHNFPEGVHITKKNEGGGFGDSSCSFHYENQTRPIPDTETYAYNRTFYDVLRGFETCVDKRRYDAAVKSFVKTQHIPSDLCQQESCEVFDGFTQYYEKGYSASNSTGTLKFPAIIFMIEFETDKIVQGFGGYFNAIERRDINIVDCTETALFDFFRIEGKDIDTERLFYDCKGFVEQRDNIYTSDIFNLIDLAAEFLDVKKVNILDESCNVLTAKKGCKGPISKCGKFKLGMVREPHIAYGGRRKSKSNRKLKRKSKRLP